MNLSPVAEEKNMEYNSITWYVVHALVYIYICIFIFYNIYMFTPARARAQRKLDIRF